VIFAPRGEVKNGPLVEAVIHLSDLITKMKRAGRGIGDHVIDKELLP
jgi:hypothetical protein